MISHIPVLAQVDTAWVRRYNGPGNFDDQASALAVDDSGNVYVTGVTDDVPFENTSDYTTIKYTPNGDTLWVRRYNGQGNSSDEPSALAVDDSGNVYVTGVTDTYYPFTTGDYATIKYAPNGDTLWVRRYDGPGNSYDGANALAVDESGKVYVTGNSGTIKYLPNGDTAWVREAGGALAVDESGNVYVTGSSGGDYATIKYAPNGDTLWDRRYNGPGNDYDAATAIVVDASGNVYLTGFSVGNGTSDDYATIKYAPNGDTLWVRRYNGPGNNQDWASALAVDGSGNVYVTGVTDVGFAITTGDYTTIKYAPNGDTLWVRRYNGPENSADYASALALDGSGNLYVTGFSGGSGTGNDYATIKYAPNGDTLWVRRFNGPGGSDSRASALAVDGSGNVYVTGLSFGNGSYDYATIKYVQTEKPIRILILDAQGNPIKEGQTFRISTVANDPPNMTEAYLGDFTTDSQGKVTLPDYSKVGNWIKVEKVLHTEVATKHRAILDTAYTISVDNTVFDQATGATSFELLNSDPEQVIILRNTTVIFDLLISVEWDATQEYFESLTNGLRQMSNYIYDVFDGQARIGDILIFDNKEYWNDADVRIYASNMVWPNSTVPLLNVLFGLPGYMNLPLKWFGDSDFTRNGTRFEHPLNLDVSVDYKTKAHELGHYLFGFYDEYVGWLGNKVSHIPVHGFMESQFDFAGARGSEMSRSAVEYADLEGRDTRQWLLNGMGCADQFEEEYQKTYGGIFAQIIRPDERPDNVLSGPNDDLKNLNYNVGMPNIMNIQINNADYGGIEPLVLVQNKGVPIYQSDVTIKKPNGRKIKIGQTADDGYIRLRGYNDGDLVRAQGGKEKFVGSLDGTNLQHINEFVWYSSGGYLIDSGGILVMNIRRVQGEFPFIHSISFKGTSLIFELSVANHPSSAPELEVEPDESESKIYLLSQNGQKYSVSIFDSLGKSGRLILHTTDNSPMPFEISNPYLVQTIQDSVVVLDLFGPNGASQLSLDSSNAKGQSVIILASMYPPLRVGVGTESFQGGEIVSFSLSKDNILQGTNTLTIYYRDSDFGDSATAASNELNLRIWKWDEDSLNWKLEGGSVDTERNKVTSTIIEAGVYAAFTVSCISKPGDANGDNKILLSDIVKIINFLFKGAPAPNPFCRADANADGKVLLSDIVYLINFLFKSGPAPMKSGVCCL